MSGPTGRLKRRKGCEKAVEYISILRILLLGCLFLKEQAPRKSNARLRINATVIFLKDSIETSWPAALDGALQRRRSPISVASVAIRGNLKANVVTSTLVRPLLSDYRIVSPSIAETKRHSTRP